MYIISHRIDAIPIRFINILKAYGLVDARFVPSLHVCGFDGKTKLPLDPLLAALGLSKEPPGPTTNGNLPAGAPAERPVQSQQEGYIADSQERRWPSLEELDQIASDLRDIILQPENAQASYNDFVSNLGIIESLVPRAQSLWNANANIAATKLVQWARIQGRRMLGRLLEEVVRAAPGRDDTGELVQIASECGLLASETISELRTMIESMEVL